MKNLIKPIVMLIFLAQFSCVPYKSLTKNDPITRDLLLSLEPYKTYKFELKTGQIMMVHVQTVSSERLTGYTIQSGDVFQSKDNYYSDTLDNLEQHVHQISRRKFSPLLTVVVCSIPVVVGIVVSTHMDLGFGSPP